MKNNKVLRYILLSSLILTGCGKGSNISSNSVSSDTTTSESISQKAILSSITVNTKKSKTSYELGEEFVKPVVYAHYDNADDKDVSNLCTFNGFKNTEKGEITVTVTYVEDSKTVNTTYKVTITDKTLSFEDAAKLVLRLKNNEIQNSNSASKLYTTVSGKTEDIVKEDFINYASHDSSSTGVYTRKSKGVVELTDNFKTINTRTVDKYKNDDGSIDELDVFVSIKDFENDASSNYYYKDKVSKKFILKDEPGVEYGNLTSDYYILESNYAELASANTSNDLFEFIAGYLYGNIYLEQLEYTRIVVSPVAESNDVLYSFDASYFYDADGGSKMEEAFKLQFKVNSNEKLTSFSYSYLATESSKADPTDSYTSGFMNEVTISYGNKETEKKDVLNIDDYFVRTITEIKVLARNSNFDDVEVDPTNISSNYSYIFAQASKYFPRTAVDYQLTPVRSSNTDVVTLERDMFKIVGEGTAELAFSYYQKIDGIYELSYKFVKVTITAMKVESVGFGTYDTNFYQQYGLCTSFTYDWPVNISPYKADGTITAVSSDESILKVQIVKDREVKLIPVGEGRATVTITSTNNPEAKASKDFYVLDPKMDYKEYLTKTTFKHNSPYGYTFEMKFNADGTGTRQRVITSSGEIRNDTFKYSIEGNKIKFSNFSSASLDDNSYVRGIIIREFDKAGNPYGIYAETTAKGQPFYAL